MGRVELPAERAEAPCLHLDQLTVRADEVDHEPPDWHLQAVTRSRQSLLDRGVQRTFTHHADTRHARRG